MYKWGKWRAYSIKTRSLRKRHTSRTRGFADDANARVCVNVVAETRRALSFALVKNFLIMALEVFRGMQTVHRTEFGEHTGPAANL